MRDFTLESYKNLLHSLNEYTFLGVSEYLKMEHKGAVAVMRHDVDRRPLNSLAVAKIEASLGLKSTYYFRITYNSFNSSVIREIRDLGHEIGFHYEELAMANGDFDLAKDMFERHLDKIRKIAPISSVAMHGRPLSKFDNRDFWKKFELSQFGLLSEAFFTIDYSDFYYFTDTGRTWSESGANLRDRVSSLLPNRDVQSTEDLIEFIQSERPNKIALVMHPERWDREMAPWVFQYAKDCAINSVKRVLQVVRR